MGENVAFEFEACGVPCLLLNDFEDERRNGVCDGKGRCVKYPDEPCNIGKSLSIFLIQD